MSEEQKPIKKLKHGRFSRALDFAGLLAGAGQKAIKYKIQSQLKGATKENLALELMTKQVQVIAEKLGNLKGGLMKVGQMLSVYGEYFLPKEVNETLKNLQSQSRPFAWSELEKILVQDFGEDILKKLTVDPTPYASASIGQVHKALDLATQKTLALKIQYPDISKAIFSDLKSLKNLFSVMNLFPQISHMNLLFDEVESMLSQELDYFNEMQWSKKYASALKGDNRYVVPPVYDEYTSTHVIATEFQQGYRLDSERVLNLSQEKRNEIAKDLLEIYFKELFLWGFVQTDPHIGNYLVKLDDQNNHQVVLLDFGAVREYSKDFLANYRKLIAAALKKDFEGVKTASMALGFNQPQDPESLKQAFYNFCLLMIEPFSHDTEYDWATTDLPKRLTRSVANVIKEFSVRVPPREVVFLDRKTAGVFISMNILKAKMNSRELFESYLKD